jgi:hypothetical protein
MWWFVFIISIASIALGGKMAQECATSFRLWIAAFVGPLPPLALPILRCRASPASKLGNARNHRMSVVGKEAEV